MGGIEEARLMDVPVLVAIGFGVAGASYVMLTYNGLVSLRARAEGAWADIDVQLKKRWELVPRLVETVKGYSEHESGTLEEVTRARAAAERAEGEGAAARGVAESAVGSGVARLVALVEAYPDLKASEMYASLHRELVEVEDALQSARRYYNAVVRDLNTRIDQFPSNLVAGVAGVKRREYFEIEDALERSVPRVSVGDTA